MTGRRNSFWRREGIAAALFSCWCLFWMVQPAIYWTRLTTCKWLGLPAHYAFWVLGMVIVVPASCFAFAAWANRFARGRKQP